MMTDGHTLQFICQGCESPVLFSVLNSKEFDGEVMCQRCGKKYAFDDETIMRHLRHFEALCRQIHASSEILGNTAIAVDVGSHHVKVPFNILLTRLSSLIELQINGKEFCIEFRIEPLKDVTASL